MIKIGNNTISTIYFGNSIVQKIYIGSVQLWINPGSYGYPLSFLTNIIP